jgi:hypothetical protein
MSNFFLIRKYVKAQNLTFFDVKDIDISEEKLYIIERVN